MKRPLELRPRSRMTQAGSQAGDWTLRAAAPVRVRFTVLTTFPAALYHVSSSTISAAAKEAETRADTQMARFAFMVIMTNCSTLYSFDSPLAT